MTKRIEYDPETRDYALYADGQWLGYARTYAEAERRLDAYVYEALRRRQTEVAA